MSETVWNLLLRVKHGDYRTVAVAWIARLHACVTLHIVSGGDATARWTRESERMARAVQTCGDDDAAVVTLVETSVT